MKEQVLAVLTRAAEMIEIGWTQGADARRKDGTACTAVADGADAYCLSGALLRAGYEVSGRLHDPSKPMPTFMRAVYTAVQAVLPPGWTEIQWYNDRKGRTKADMLRIIAAARAALA